MLCKMLLVMILFGKMLLVKMYYVNVIGIISELSQLILMVEFKAFFTILLDLLSPCFKVFTLETTMLLALEYFKRHHLHLIGFSWK